ncbi:hypothetical protein Dimus_029168 [Dionaea muscipula]
MVNQAKSEDGELRERLGRRRSSRISPSILSSFSDLGEGRAFGLTTAVKIDSLGVPADDPRRCGDSDPRCAADLELGLPLSPIVEEVGLDGGKIQIMELSVVEKRSLIEGEIQNMERSLAGVEFQTTDGDARPMMEDGQASSVLPDSPSQVVSYPSPLLPMEISTVGLEELGEGIVNSMQVSSLPRVPVAMHNGLSTEVKGGHHAQMLRTQCQEEDLRLGVPLMAGTGRDSLQTVAGHVEPAIPLTPGDSPVILVMSGASELPQGRPNGDLTVLLRGQGLRCASSSPRLRFSHRSSPSSRPHRRCRAPSPPRIARSVLSPVEDVGSPEEEGSIGEGLFKEDDLHLEKEEIAEDGGRRSGPGGAAMLRDELPSTDATGSFGLDTPIFLDVPLISLSSPSYAAPLAIGGPEMVLVQVSAPSSSE